MVDADAVFRQHLLRVAQAEAVGLVPARAWQNQRAVKMATFEHGAAPGKRSSRHATANPDRTFATEPFPGRLWCHLTEEDALSSPRKCVKQSGRLIGRKTFKKRVDIGKGSRL